MRQHYILVIGDDVRECFVEDNHFVHVLNTGWKIAKDDPRLTKIKTLKTVS